MLSASKRCGTSRGRHIHQRDRPLRPEPRAGNGESGRRALEKELDRIGTPKRKLVDMSTLLWLARHRLQGAEIHDAVRH